MKAREGRPSGKKRVVEVRTQGLFDKVDEFKEENQVGGDESHPSAYSFHSRYSALSHGQHNCTHGI